MSPFDPQKHHRRSIRLNGYDYTQAGAYFVTVVTLGRECLFGEIINGETVLNEYGKIVQKWWDDIPNHFPGVETGAFVVMPNHVHGVFVIVDDGRGAVPAPSISAQEDAMESGLDGGMLTLGRGNPAPTKKPTLGQIVAYFKYKSTKEMNMLDAPGVVTKFWQRNYYERIIRNDREMDAIWNYIEGNPSAWADDDENPNKLGRL
jgi:REP element-mobilizing transposase RayT